LQQLEGQPSKCGLLCNTHRAFSALTATLGAADPLTICPLQNNLTPSLIMYLRTVFSFRLQNYYSLCAENELQQVKENNSKKFL